MKICGLFIKSFREITLKVFKKTLLSINSMREDNFSIKDYFRTLKHHLPIREIKQSDYFVDKKSEYYPLFLHFYKKMEAFYEHLPRRKNGEAAFVHPINVIFALKQAEVTDDITFCVALLHDFLEEMVDVYKKNEGLKEDKEGIPLLDAYELKVADALEKELVGLVEKHNLDQQTVQQILKPVKLLTRHKRHFYLMSISGIFNYSGEEIIKQRAIQVKLADRTHNIMCIECFDEQGRLYQCFKNLFIINNAKKYLLDKYGGADAYVKRIDSPDEVLYNKCAKATFDAFQKIMYICTHKGIEEYKFILQLAFKKYKLSRDGIAAVTAMDPKENHPMRLFQGVVWKYDARLHHEWKKFDEIKLAEIAYVKEFFGDCNLTGEQLRAILDYKDAYALKEVVGQLVYDPPYYVQNFISSKLSNDGRIRYNKWLSSRSYFGGDKSLI